MASPQTVWMGKNGNKILASLRQAEQLESKGYEPVSPPKVKAAAPKPVKKTVVLGTGQVRLWNGSSFCICDVKQIDSMRNDGWLSEEELSDIGGNEASSDETTEVKTEVKPDEKTEVKTEVKPDEKTEVKPTPQPRRRAVGGGSR